MAKWVGNIGYANPVNKGNGVNGEEIIVKRYVGDLVKNNRRWNNTNSVNGDITISNQISIICDPYAMLNFQNIRYAEFMGAKWKISDVDVQYPRLLLTLGGVYNEQ